MQRSHHRPCFCLTKPKEGAEMEVCGTDVPAHFRTKLLGQAQSHGPELNGCSVNDIGGNKSRLRSIK